MKVMPVQPLWSAFGVPESPRLVRQHSGGSGCSRENSPRRKELEQAFWSGGEGYGGQLHAQGMSQQADADGMDSPWQECEAAALQSPMWPSGAGSMMQPQTMHSQNEACGETWTTVMLLGLPEGLSRDSLLEVLDVSGFAGTYDFVYIPVNFETMVSLDHAFINMVSVEDVERLRRFVEEHSWNPPGQEAICWNNKYQGLPTLIDRYRNSPMMHQFVPDACKPAIFSGGRRVPFPPPTAAIKAPKAFRNDAAAQAVPHLPLGNGLSDCL